VDDAEPWLPLECELLVVDDESAEGLLLDAVTIGDSGEGNDHLPAGTPITLWLADPDGKQEALAAELRSLVRAETCRIGTMNWNGNELLVARGREDCVVVLLVPGGN
jgi:hypothetical protein